MVFGFMLSINNSGKDYFIDTSMQKLTVRPDKLERKRKKPHTNKILVAINHEYSSNNKIVRGKLQIAVYRV